MNPAPESVIAASTELGALGVPHLKNLWSWAAAVRQGIQVERETESHLDRLLMDGLGLGLEQTLGWLLQNPSTFEQFEHWVLETAGRPDPAPLARIDAIVAGKDYPGEITHQLLALESAPPVLSPDDLAFWEEHGYVVLREAVEPARAAEAEEAIWEFLGAKREEPDSWYRELQNGIMLQFFQHPAFTANRRSPRIHKAFTQLWKTPDLWVTTDRCGFNPPEREEWPFPGPDLHWDVDINKPIAFGTQGILYLTETLPGQGALTLVPGFHRRIDVWLRTLAPGCDPQKEDLHALGSVPVGGRAGDLVIWHSALPHGSRPNLEQQPRIVQYINMYPARIG